MHMIKLLLKTKKGENVELKFFLHIDLHIIHCLGNKFTELLRRADARGKDDIIYRM